MNAPALMLQGTGSDVGKSVLVAGLCRAFTRRGLRVRPFKPQNMSNNAAVTVEDGEIGRAQALQARACRLSPSIDMNPVLLKPQSETGAQLVVQGKVWGNVGAADYRQLAPRLLRPVVESFGRIAAEADLVLVEGAGSAAEVNLRLGDIANMGFAEAARVPVVLVGDIERGGVIAQIVGTWTLLSAPERARTKGCIVNKFRGDVRLFAGGIEAIAARTDLPCLGVVPYFARARRLPAEDGMALDAPATAADRPIRIAVPRLSRIANFDDFDPLIAEPDVSVDFVAAGSPLPRDADLVILPGSKATLADLSFLRAQGWDIDILSHRRHGGQVLGLCGGFQMLGRRVADPEGIEGPAGETPGLGLLDVETVLAPAKTLAEVTGEDVASGCRIKGYRMHLGQTTGAGLARPMLRLGAVPDGALSADGRVRGCYVHGLFAADEFRHAFLAALKPRPPSGVSFESAVEETLDELADHLESHLDLGRLLEIARAR